MVDVSASGLRCHLIASNTFPVGVPLTQFADDGDSLDAPALEMADMAPGLNGDGVSWSKPTVKTVTLNLIPNSIEDKALSLIAQANMVAKNKKPAGDKFTLVVYYPSGSVSTYSNGVMTSAMIGNSATAAGRMKSKTYTFKFEGVVAA